MFIALPLLAVLFCALTLAGTAPALTAVETAQGAKMCRQLAIEAHPTQIPGVAQGTAQAQREYFRDCVAQMQQQDHLLLTDEERSLILRYVQRRGGSTLALGALSEGAEVPRAVTVMVFPKNIVVALPKMAAYRYFSVENAVAIVDPTTLKVLSVIDDR
jgi:Protein of unknown function (DUF1236)